MKTTLNTRLRATEGVLPCPGCQCRRIAVIDSRVIGDAVRRRRECADCGYRWTTYETWETETPRQRERSRDAILLHAENLERTAQHLRTIAGDEPEQTL